MSTNLPLLHTSSPIKNKSFKFQRTGSPVYRLSRSSSSDTDSLSKFYVKISGHFSEDKAICGTLQTRLSKRDILVGKCSIKAKRLKFANNQKEQIKVKKKLTLENPPSKGTHIITREEEIREIQAQNQQLKRKQQLLQKIIENLKLQIQHKNTQIQVLEIEARHSPATLSTLHPDSPFLKPREFTQPSQYSQKYTDHPQIIKKINFQENTFDGTGSTELSITRPESSFDFGNFSQCSHSLSTEVQLAQQEISRLQVVHNFELRKLNKELEYYKKNKEKEMKMLKDKFNQLLNKFKEVSKKAASLEIQCIIDKKSRGKTQSQSLAECIKDFEEFYALSSDEEK